MTQTACWQMSRNFIILACLQKLLSTIEQVMRAFHLKLSNEELVDIADGMKQASHIPNSFNEIVTSYISREKTRRYNSKTRRIDIYEIQVT